MLIVIVPYSLNQAENIPAFVFCRFMPSATPWRYTTPLGENQTELRIKAM
jgi:hypothetical protein